MKCFPDETSSTCGKDPGHPLTWREKAVHTLSGSLNEWLLHLVTTGFCSWTTDAQGQKTPRLIDRNPYALLRSLHGWADPKVDGEEPLFASSCTWNDQARSWAVLGHNSPLTIQASLQWLPCNMLEAAFSIHRVIWNLTYNIPLFSFFRFHLFTFF